MKSISKYLNVSHDGKGGELEDGVFSVCMRVSGLQKICRQDTDNNVHCVTPLLEMPARQILIMSH